MSAEYKIKHQNSYLLALFAFKRYKWFPRERLNLESMKNRGGRTQNFVDVYSYRKAYSIFCPMIRQTPIKKLSILYK